MKEVSINFNTVDENKMEIFAKIEIFCAALAAITVTLDNLAKYKGIELLLPVGSLLISMANTIAFVFYKKLKDKLKIKFDMLFQMLAGLTCYLTAANYFFMGGTLRMTIIYIVLGSGFMFLIPLLMLKGKFRSNIVIDNDKMFINYRLKKNESVDWENIKELKVYENHFEMTTVNEKPKKYYFVDNNVEDQKNFKNVLQDKICELELI